MSTAVQEFEESGGSLKATGENSTPAAMNEASPEVALTQMITSSPGGSSRLRSGKAWYCRPATSRPKSPMS